MKKTILAVFALIASGTAVAQNMDFTSGSLIVDGLLTNPTEGQPFNPLPLATGLYADPLAFVPGPGPFSTAGGTGPLALIGGSNILIPQILVLGVVQEVVDAGPVTPGTQYYNGAFTAPLYDIWNPATGYITGSGVETLTVVPDPVTQGEFAVTQAVFTFQPVPEPGTLALFALGLVGLATRRKAPSGTATRN